MKGFEMRDGNPHNKQPMIAKESPSGLVIASRVNAKVLNPGEINGYHENGFVVVKGAIPADEARQLGDEINWAIDKIRNGENVQWGGTFVNDEERGRQVINDLHGGQRVSPRITRWLTDPRHVIAPAQLIGPEVALHHIKAVAKPGKKDGKIGGIFPMHQDHPFFKLRNSQVLAGLLACTEGNEENGGLVGFPGSHKRGWLIEDHDPDPHDPTKRQAQLSRKKWPSEEATLIPTEPGDMILFSVNFVHGSGTNTTDKPRINLISQLMHPSNIFTEQEEKDKKNPHQSHAQGMMLCDARDLKRWGVPRDLLPEYKPAKAAS